MALPLLLVVGGKRARREHDAPIFQIGLMGDMLIKVLQDRAETVGGVGEDHPEPFCEQVVGLGVGDQLGPRHVRFVHDELLV